MEFSYPLLILANEFGSVEVYHFCAQIQTGIWRIKKPQSKDSTALAVLLELPRSRSASLLWEFCRRFGGGGETLEAKLRTISWLAPYSRTVSFGVVVGIITYLSLVVGELVPKQLALGHPERVALIMAKPMRLLSRITKPAVWILSASSGAILKLLRIGPVPEPDRRREIKS
jgi:hypothetical protein